MTIPNSHIEFGNNMRVDLFSEIAKEKASEVYQAGLDQRGQQQVKNKSTQLRRFYDELVLWSDKVNATGRMEPGRTSGDVRAERYRQSAPFIKMMCAKVAYARGRNHVDVHFEELFSHCIKSVVDADTLRHAKLFMEAFMGFYKAQEK